MTRAFLAILVAAVAAAGIWAEHRAPAGLLPSPRRPYQSYGSPQVRTETAAYPRYATGADDVRVRMDRPVRRIVSQNTHADEYLYVVVPAERIVGVSETAYDRRFSNVYEYAARYHPIVANDPERVLLTNPDLVITAESVRAEVPDLLRQAGVPVYRMYSMFETLASIEAHVRLIGYLTGEDDRAEAEILRFQGVIAQAAARRPANTPALFWTMGGLESRTWAHVWLSTPFVAIGLVSAWLQSRTMDLLLLGEPHAASRGVDVEGSKRILLVTAALLTGASVAVAGLIGFVGLVVPHGVRLLLGPRHRTLLPAAAIAGAAFLIACDIAARTARPPAAIRLGVVTALCGAPLFLIILMKRLRGDAR